MTRWGGGLRAMAGGLNLLLALGCLVIPTPEHGLVSGRGRLTAGLLATLVPGTTTREEVLARLGEPTQVHAEERAFVYQWTVYQHALIIGDRGDDLWHSHAVLVRFRPDGRVASVREGDTFGAAPGLVAEWVQAGDLPPLPPPRGFVVDAWPPMAPGPPLPVALRVAPFQDARTGTSTPSALGTRSGTKLWHNGLQEPIQLARPAAQLVEAFLASQLQLDGAEVRATGEVPVLSGVVLAFQVDSQRRFGGEDVRGLLKLQLRIAPRGGGPAREFLLTSEATRELNGWRQPADEGFDGLVVDLLEDLRRQLRANPEFWDSLK